MLQNVLCTMLDILTPDDVRMLAETLDEDSRKGGFLRVFPSSTSQSYLQYFEQPRYYNLLLQQWIQHYGNMPSQGLYECFVITLNM